MSITSVFAKVKEGLALVLKAEGVELLAHELGSNHLSDALTAPAIIWCPLGASTIIPIAGPTAPVARRTVRPDIVPGTGEIIDTKRIGEPAQYANREERIEIHVWGKTFTETEELLNHLVAMMRVQLSGHSFKPVSTDWQLGQSQNAKAYHVCLFTCVIKVPFTFEPMGIARAPLTVDIEGEILEPGEALS